MESGEMTSWGVDVLIDRDGVSELELRDALAQVVSVSHDRVSVIDEIKNYPFREEADVVCTVSKVEGQFPTLLSIDGTGSCEDALLLVERLSGALEAGCLTGTDDVNPYAMWYIK
ncbi:MAG: hypothetical protein ABMA64_40775, partial [Myxococcota bacterium]